MSRNFLVFDPEEGMATLRALASPTRVKILKLLQRRGPLNINHIAEALQLPQSSVSSNIQVLEEGKLVVSETRKARKGNQKVCRAAADEVVVLLKDEFSPAERDYVEVAMPLGLYTSYEVSAPCGLCASEGIIGLLDVPNSFLDPDRMKAGLLWFTRGFVEYQFPNNAKMSNISVDSLEFAMELSSEVPGTSADWPSDITLWVNGVEIGTWTSPGDFGDKRGVYTPVWWKLEGSQYGKMKNFQVNGTGSFVDGNRISDVTVADLDIQAHHSVRLCVGIRNDAKHPGGINIFGRGFGNYDQDIVMRVRPSA